MASGIQRSYSGAYIGTGAELSVTQIGFRPKLIILINMTDAAIMFHIDQLPDDQALKQKGSSTSALSSTAITLLANGFKILGDTDLNVAGETVYFIAFE